MQLQSVYPLANPQTICYVAVIPDQRWNNVGPAVDVTPGMMVFRITSG